MTANVLHIRYCLSFLVNAFLSSWTIIRLLNVVLGNDKWRHYFFMFVCQLIVHILFHWCCIKHVRTYLDLVLFQPNIRAKDPRKFNSVRPLISNILYPLGLKSETFTIAATCKCSDCTYWDIYTHKRNVLHECTFLQMTIR